MQMTASTSQSLNTLECCCFPRNTCSQDVFPSCCNRFHRFVNTSTVRYRCSSLERVALSNYFKTSKVCVSISQPIAQNSPSKASPVCVVCTNTPRWQRRQQDIHIRIYSFYPISLSVLSFRLFWCIGPSEYGSARRPFSPRRLKPLFFLARAQQSLQFAHRPRRTLSLQDCLSPCFECAGSGCFFSLRF
jgi:hypothetical protein